jgi:hypothetical protein
MFWAALAYLNVVVKDPSFWRSTPARSGTSRLTIDQRLQMPGKVRDSVVVIGGDSSDHLGSTVNWNRGEYVVVVWTKPLEDALRDRLMRAGTPATLITSDFMISVKELIMGGLVPHLIWGRFETGKLYLNLNDNDNAKNWIRKRVAKNPFVQQLLMVNTHSLRIGGATSLIHQGVHPDVVRRYGRWLSDCWKLYTFTTRERIAGLSSVIASSSYTLEQSAADFHALRNNMARDAKDPGDEETVPVTTDGRSAASESTPLVQRIDETIEAELLGKEWFNDNDRVRCHITGFTFDTYDDKVLRVVNYNEISDTGEVTQCYSTIPDALIELRKYNTSSIPSPGTVDQRGIAQFAGGRHPARKTAERALRELAAGAR